MLNYELKERIEAFKVKGSLNIESSRIYKKYRKDNGASRVIHIKANRTIEDDFILL